MKERDQARPRVVWEEEVRADDPLPPGLPAAKYRIVERFDCGYPEIFVDVLVKDSKGDRKWDVVSPADPRFEKLIAYWLVVGRHKVD